MKNFMMAVAAALALAPAAVAQTQSQMIVGRWTCSADTPDGFISAQMNYGADGVAHSTMIMSFGEPGALGQVIMEITSSWRAPGDGTLREKVTDLDVLRFTMNGEENDPDALESQGEDMMRDELQSGSLQLTKNSLTMIDEEGVRTSCIR